MRLTAELVDQRLVSRGGRVAPLADRLDHGAVEARLARKLLVYEPFMLAGPLARGDEHGQLDQLLRQLALPAQLLAQRLQMLGDRRVVQERDERSAYFAPRA